MTTLSIIIITKNESRNIRRCLQSVAWADEIIVIDSGSTDDTVAICKEFTDKVFVTDWPGFGIQKNRALAKATSEWVFSIDADEWLVDESIDEIKQVIQRPTYDAYWIPRANRYLDSYLRHGDVGNDKVIRLFKKSKARFSDDKVHEQVIIEGNVGDLKKPLHHHSYQSVEEILQRMNQYTTLSAEMRQVRGKQTSFLKAIMGGFWAFIKSYFLRGGFRDGKMGFIVAVTSAESSYYRHLKLLYFNTSCDKSEG